jgi:uroporphyrin-III C-methyltransferase
MSRPSNLGVAQPGAGLMISWRLEGKRVLVIGGGAVAAARVHLALEAGAQVHLIAPELNTELRARHQRNEITWAPRAFEGADDLRGADLLLTAIDDPQQSLQIVTLARAARLPTNAADIPKLCDFWFPSVHRDGPVQIAVSTNGQGPALARRLKNHIVAHLPPGFADATQRFGYLRRRLRAHVPQASASAQRMHFLKTISHRWSWSQLTQLDDAAIEATVAAFPEPPSAPSAQPGSVRLVGAGPGDPDLLTRAARTALQTADLVVADRLIDPAILALITGQLRIAQKRPGRAEAAQRELDQWVLAGVDAGQSVVRLKCGDPFIYGRGLEELHTYAAAGVPAQIISGLSSAYTAPLAAGIPVTHRGYSDRVLLLTGHGARGAHPTVPAYQPNTTYLWLMAVGRLAALVDTMLAQGYPEHWPAALIERGTRPGQRALRAPLSALPGLARQHQFAAPAVIIISPTVALADPTHFEVDHLPAAPAARYAAGT